MTYDPSDSSPMPTSDPDGLPIESAPIESARERGGAAERLARLGDLLCRGPSVRRLAIAAGVTIVILGTLGALEVYTSIPLKGFWLDGEANVPATFSTLLLIAAAVVAATLAQREGEQSTRRALIGMTALFAYMSLDEFAAIHEELQYATGIPWQVFYVPLVIVAAYGWLIVLVRLRGISGAARMWIGAATAWTVAQLLDLAETEFWLIPHPSPDTFAPGINVLITLEETLEMAGSSLFALALLLALRSLALAPRPERPPKADRSAA